MIGYDRQRTSRMNAVGNIKEPRISWQTGMSASEYLALEMVKQGETFEGAKNGKYADEYLAMLH